MIKSCYPKDHIIDFSHVALTVSPHHPHYGRDADYQDFLHYQNNTKTIPKSGQLYQGATSKYNLENYYLKRLHYNPYFENMIQQIFDFLDDDH